MEPEPGNPQEVEGVLNHFGAVSVGVAAFVGMHLDFKKFVPDIAA